MLRAIHNLGSLGAKLAKHAPKLLTALGIAGYGYSVYEATKIPEKTKAVHEEYKRTGNKKKFIKGYVKAVGPCLASFSAATVSTLGGMNILHGHCLRLGAALTAQQTIHRKYRERVIAKEGPEADMEYSMGLAETTEIMPQENGEMAVVHGQKIVGDPASLYTMIFDERNIEWEDDPAHCILFLRNRLQDLNDRLKASRSDFVKGHLSVMDAWKELRFDRLLDKEQTNAAIIGGWTDDATISFGPQFDSILRDPRPFLLGKIPYIVIELNPSEGVLIDKI